MTIGNILAQEMEQESATTRKYLERVPEDKWDWKPHEKSMPFGRLASHVADSNGWGAGIVEFDNFSMKTGEFEAFNASSKEELLQNFDEGLAKLLELLRGADDATMQKNWQMIVDGNVMFEMPKMVCIRAWVINHMIHHRGQLSVYLRENDIPVPATYGPSADEQM